ncbi:complement C1q-like protein 2 [Saccostrea cucullata]|uniref:complement C1q-like protein 2 n=1 Tax=Saccostrea cuccullata TaxID=36930 RepID=UPI002ED624AE
MVKDLGDRLRLSDKKVGELTRDLEHSGVVLQGLVKQRHDKSDKEYPFPPDEQRTNNTNLNYNKVQKNVVPGGIRESQDRFQRLLIPATQLPSVAFYAHAAGHQNGLGAGQTIKYPTVVTNVGNGFDPKVGIFRAPVAGVYFFTTTLISDRGETVRSTIVHNNQNMAYVFAGNEGTHGSGSNSVVLHLMSGHLFTTQTPMCLLIPGAHFLDF